MAQRIEAVTWARATLNCGCRACAFFDCQDDECEILPPFMTEGLDAGDRSIHIMDNVHLGERVRCLTEAGSTRRTPVSLEVLL